MKLVGSLYGLNNAARVWFVSISEEICKDGLEQMECAPYAFKNDRVIVECYVNDLLAFAKADKDIARLKRKHVEDLIARIWKCQLPSLALNFFSTKEPCVCV